MGAGAALIYRKVFTCLWGDRKFRALSAPQPNAQTLWHYLLTGEHTEMVPGLARVGEAALAEALGWPLEALRPCWGEIEAQGMAHADWGARVVWLPNAVRYNPPENPNVVKSWARAWAGIPECDLKEAARRKLEEHVAGRGEAFVAAFHQACPKPSGKGHAERSRKRSRQPSANQEQEQEQEQPPSPPARAASAHPQVVEAFCRLWLEVRQGDPYVVVKGKDGKAVKDLLAAAPAAHELSEVEARIRRYLAANWARENGGLAHFCSRWSSLDGASVPPVRRGPLPLPVTRYWHERLTPEQSEAFRQERHQVAPELDGAPLAATGFERGGRFVEIDQVKALIERWRDRVAA